MISLLMTRRSRHEPASGANVKPLRRPLVTCPASPTVNASTRSDGRLTVVEGKPLPGGWAGKVWALEQGRAVAMRRRPLPGYMLLTDGEKGVAITLWDSEENRESSIEIAQRMTAELRGILAEPPLTENFEVTFNLK